MKEKIVIGSRGSILALAQSEMIKGRLQKNFPDLKFEIKIIVTSGDKDLVSNWNNSDKSLKSFFTKEIEHELLEGTIDLAVHSMKDMPIVSPPGLICGATPDREDNRDVLVSKSGKKLLELPKGAVVGTSSLRRTMGLKALRPDLEIKQLRGNIHTRLRKLDEDQYDAILLAAAGLKRVGLGERITEELEYDLMMPAPAQGALHIQCRENDAFIKSILKTIHNPKIEEIVDIEREFSKIFDGGCHTPMGCTGEKFDGKIFLRGVYCHNNIMYKAEVLEDEKLGKEIAHKLAAKIREKING
ncbi:MULTISPECIES: hydroxymethylbilane synthase [Cetobacterium]|jgi:hydroxymethylbilane synthase|uniref:Porphobilinogen deaminase n=1 Tax=Candidatus Cetobacterium colombiensis TaxID=3073100 RepID=A0ABU4WA59_9FUSO|nr:hydroxymethylbilane synthase [Candidatus Cetobacterium colombiensis]MDX8336418.1 hydroxymethylbilane synthase [Candidatus Cetobacterium colombiensis]